MGKIRQLREDQLINGGSQEHIYPITHAKAVYSKDNGNLQDIVDSIREGNFLKDGSIKTRHLNDKAVTTSKLGDGSVDNRVLAIDAVTYDKLKDKSVITEKLNDRAVTTEKVEEKAITNTKLGDQSVDGRVVREASIEGKHIGNNAVSTSKIASRSVTNEKIAHDSVSRAELTPDVRLSIDKKADAEQVNNSLYNLEKKIGDRFIIEGDVTNLPDEEDLTSVKESEHDVLKLADRSYAPENFSGKGYKILRRNIKPVSIAVTKIRVESVPLSDGTLSFTINGKETQVAVSAITDNTTALVAKKVAAALQDSMTEYDVSIDASLITLTRKSNGSVTPSVFSASTTGVVCTVTDSTKRELSNILTPVMINQPNTIYEIRYDFDLNGETIEVQDNCTLNFHGGKLKNGTIKGNNTQIDAAPSIIFDNIAFSGRWRIYNYYPEWFISDFSDCTNGIQQAINFASINNGGKIVFQSRQYNVKSIHTGIKTNLIGSGIGATIIKQIEGLKDTHCIDIPNTSAGVRIENMTILGNQEAGNNGISKAQFIDGGENHKYIYTELSNWDKIQAYRWCVIRNVAVYKFDKGIYLANHFFCCYIEKVICSDNLQYGIHFACTDSSILNTYLNHNGVHGLYLEGSNNKIIGLKSIFNGYKKHAWNAAYLVLGSKNQLIGCESQDNYCTGFCVAGVKNTFTGCISNTDGYKPSDNYVYEKDPSVRNFAFLLDSAKGENSFSGCIATNYLNKPIPERFLFDSSDPSNSFEGIDIILGKDLYEGYKMDRKDSNLYMNNTEVRDYLIKEKYENKFFAPVEESPAYINFNNNIQLAGINILVDFVIDQSTLTDSKRLFTIGDIEIVVVKEEPSDYIVAYVNNENYCILSSISAYNRNQERRLLLTITKNKIVLKGFFHDGNGMKQQVSEHDYSYSKTVSSMKLNSHECLNLRRLLLFYGHVDCKYLIPAIPLNNIYERAVIKLDANTYDMPKTIGSSNEKPKNVSVGFVFHDTTENKTFMWNGSVWIELGSVV